MTPSPARPGVSRIAVKAYAVLVALGLLMATVFHLTIVEAVRDNALAQQEQSALALIEQARLNLESEAQWLTNLEAHELERRLEHLKSFIQVALTITEDVHLGHHDMALLGATRREHALEHIQSLRFGHGNYVWVIDGQGLTLAHPNPDLVGRNVSDLKDARGRPVIRPFLEQLKTTEEASNRYLFPRAGSSEPVEKLSHARRFAPWDWIIGSGIYLAEYQAALAQERRDLIRRTDERMRRLRLNSSGYLFIFDGQRQLISHPRREAIRADDAPERRQDKLDTLLSGLRKVDDAGGAAPRLTTGTVPKSRTTTATRRLPGSSTSPPSTGMSAPPSTPTTSPPSPTGWRGASPPSP
ncbi:MAG: cache domain-containing protein [Candidatus Sedimenticola endophacoides]